MLAFFQDMHREFGGSVIFQHPCCLGSFGGTSLKPIWLYGHMDLTHVTQQAEAFTWRERLEAGAVTPSTVTVQTLAGIIIDQAPAIRQAQRDSSIIIVSV